MTLNKLSIDVLKTELENRKNIEIKTLLESTSTSELQRELERRDVYNITDVQIITTSGHECSYEPRDIKVINNKHVVKNC